MEFSRPEYWSGQPFPSPGDLPNPGTKPRSPALQADSLPAETAGKPNSIMMCFSCLGMVLSLNLHIFVVVLSLSRVWIFVTPWTAAHLPPCPSLYPVVCSNSCPLSGRCYLTIHSPLLPPSPAFNLSRHQGLFQGVGSSHQMAKVLELQLQYQSFWCIFRVDFP